jgi:hypothetical protein
LIINLQSKSSGDGMADGGGKFWNEHCVYRWIYNALIQFINKWW